MAESSENLHNSKAYAAHFEQIGAIQIYNLEVDNVSLDFMQSDYPHYKITISPGFVFVWKHGVQYTVINSHAVSDKSLISSILRLVSRNSKNTERDTMKYYYYIPGQNYVNYLYKCKEEFSLSITFSCTVDLQKNMQESNKYQQFQEFARDIDINNTGNTHRLMLQVNQDDVFSQINQYGNTLITTEWHAWRVRAAQIKDMIQHSTVNTSLEYEVKISLNNQHQLPYFLRDIDSTDMNILVSKMVDDLINYLKSLPSIRCKYDNSGNRVSAENHPSEEIDIRMKLNDRMQSRWKAYGVSEVKWLPGAEHNSIINSEIHTKLDNFNKLIDLVVDEWNSKYKPIREDIRNRCSEKEKNDRVFILNLMNLYIDYISKCNRAGIKAIPLDDFIRSLNVFSTNGHTQPLIPFQQSDALPSTESLTDADESDIPQ